MGLFGVFISCGDDDYPVGGKDLRTVFNGLSAVSDYNKMRIRAMASAKILFQPNCPGE